MVHDLWDSHIYENEFSCIVHEDDGEKNRSQYLGYLENVVFINNPIKHGVVGV